MTTRAVVFLDPYGMEVEWKTLQEIAATKAIDLWVLFPLGQAVNRLLTRKGEPPEGWARRLTAFFGTPEWKERFYRASPPVQASLFPTREEIEQEEVLERIANFEDIGEFFLERLSTIFERVSKRTLSLSNSRQIPIYLLCFAAGAPRGADTAVKIANDLLRQ